MTEFKVEGHESSILPDGNWEMCFSDEFDGDELDFSKWSFRRHLFHKAHECWIENEGIEFENSNIIFKLVKGEDGKFRSCQLQTGENWYDRPGEGRWNVAKLEKPKFVHKFGYYECRCKLQRGDNWWSAFWLQSPTIGTHYDEKRAGVEVDIYEGFFGNSYIPHHLHWGGYGPNYDHMSTVGKVSATAKSATPVDDGFHRFGVDWDEEGYTFYVDGVQSGPKLTEAVSHTDTFILIGTEVVGYRNSIPGFYKEVENLKTFDDDKFIVDYVRVFDRK